MTVGPYRSTGVLVIDDIGRRDEIIFARIGFGWCYRLENWLRWRYHDAFCWLIRRGFLTGPEAGYFHEFKIDWPQRWS